MAFEDVKDEIFDMVKPKDSLKITLDDLYESGQGDVVISILIDSHGFWAYDNRESISPDVEVDENAEPLTSDNEPSTETGSSDTNQPKAPHTPPPQHAVHPSRTAHHPNDQHALQGVQEEEVSDSEEDIEQILI